MGDPQSNIIQKSWGFGRILSAIIGFPTLAYIAYSRSLNLPLDLLIPSQVIVFGLHIYWDALLAFSIAIFMRESFKDIFTPAELFRSRIRYKKALLGNKISTSKAWKAAASKIHRDFKRRMENSGVAVASVLLSVIIFFIVNGIPDLLLFLMAMSLSILIIYSQGSWARLRAIEEGQGIPVEYHDSSSNIKNHYTWFDGLRLAC